MIRYRTGKGSRFAERDVFEEGCLPDTASQCTINVEFEAETVSELLNRIKEYHGVGDDALELDSCEETGRVDISRMEDCHCSAPLDSQIERWKKGDEQLWYVVYTYYVQKCEDVSLL